MQENYTSAQISRIIDQAVVYQCACPAQVCRAIFELRDLYEYQLNCAKDSLNDAQVHACIAKATEASHAAMEQCLGEVLKIEGWNVQTLTLPESLGRTVVKAL